MKRGKKEQIDNSKKKRQYLLAKSAYINTADILKIHGITFKKCSELHRLSIFSMLALCSYLEHFSSGYVIDCQWRVRGAKVAHIIKWTQAKHYS